LLFLIAADHDGRTADAEHQRQQRQHIYVVYGLSLMTGMLGLPCWPCSGPR